MCILTKLPIKQIDCYFSHFVIHNEMIKFLFKKQKNIKLISKGKLSKYFFILLFCDVKIVVNRKMESRLQILIQNHRE